MAGRGRDDRMKITNAHNLPQSLINVLSRSHEPTPGRYSASDIINPPWIRLLRERNYDRIEQDVSDMLWMLLGSATHYILEGGAPKESLAEEKMTVNLSGFTIVCVPDLWHDKVISDWKITSVYSFLLGDKPEWEKQLNIYKWMYAKHGFETNKLTIHAILRDWQKSKTFRDEDYPPIPFHSLDVPVWDDIDTETMIRNWIGDLDCPYPCDDVARWARPTTWAVMKEGRKTALRVFPTEEEACNYLLLQSTPPKTSIVKREGEYVRCKSYCSVSKFCSANPYKEE
jgi:hypothetical protein